MCGRFACKQCKETYEKASTYQKDGKYVKPRWHDAPNGGLEFHASANISPTEIMPVILPGSELDNLPFESDRVLLPMVWGLIPPWHKGEYKKHGLTTHNCRLEGVSASKLYAPLFKQNKRCVVVCDGFYEWQTANKSKQPYFVCSKQPKHCEVAERESWQEGSWTEEAGWTGPHLLYLAGLYHLWVSPNGDEVYNYTVMTRESEGRFSSIHHRVPLILTDEHLVQTWLDGKVSSSEAVLRVCSEKEVDDTLVSWYPVSSQVNNSRHKDYSCNRRIALKRNCLTSWLVTSDTGAKKTPQPLPE